MGGIFISYRREDSADICGRIYDHLVARYGKLEVFKDVDNIPYGADFPAYIQAKLAECSVCLAVIGSKWLNAALPDGRRRLDDPGDFVRLEIETALRLGLVVVPVLVYGAPMPPGEALPTSLDKLPHLNAAPVRLDPDFGTDIKRLCDVADRFVPQVAPPIGSPAGRRRRQLSAKARKRLLIGLTALVLVGALAGGAIHRNANIGGTLRDFYTQLWSAYNAQAAHSYLCPDVQARVPVSKIQTALNADVSTFSNADLSQITFTVLDDNYVSEAHVRIAGVMKYYDPATKDNVTLTFDNSSTNVHAVVAGGLGWCLTKDVVDPRWLSSQPASLTRAGAPPTTVHR